MKKSLYVLLLALLLFGCDELLEKTIVDDHTKPEIEIVEVTNSLYTVDYGIDNMDRGNHDYMVFNQQRKIVVDPTVSEYNRGDVIYYKTSGYAKENTKWDLGEYHIARVVGLAGEKVQIKKGQVFIDYKILEAFYSKPTAHGKYKEEYMRTKGKNSNMTEQHFEENRDLLTVPEGSVYVLGDQWWRSIDSRYLGPVSISEVEGKVLGYDM